MNNFISAKYLNEHLEDENLVLVDCRADLYDKDYGKRAYEKGHIRGAHFLNVKTDLAGEVREHGGRSPLPSLDEFKEKLESIGVSNNKVIVAYDEAKLAGAERFWWMLKYLGHDKVYILNGGINSWINEGFSLDNDVPKSCRGHFDIKLNKSMLTDIYQVKKALGDEETIIVDSRAPERYRGEVEPIDKKAGHIPGAKNYHWIKVQNENGEFKPREELQKHFEALRKYKEIILQCGSGIDACGNFAALDEIGFKPKLYLGSWSDWVSYEDSPIATGEE